ncbi:MAG: dimethyl sulfoxide reductase subunit B [Deltaproteobacteria bacterium]|nr:dimethyl sulfoxide reductase subunit B [Deltaproteobacteria bacterium]
MKLPFFQLDVSACSGCKTCVTACLDGRGDTTDRPRRRVMECVGGGWRKRPDGTWEQNVAAYYLSLSCGHCQDPPCLKACPQGALSRDDRGLTALTGECVGCRACLAACPYGAPVFDRQSGRLDKCDLCFDRWTAGLAPLCVEACPMGALALGGPELTEGLGPQPQPLPDWRTTKPRLAANRPPKLSRQVQNFKTVNPEEL